MKFVVAVSPYIHKDIKNFKNDLYNSWKGKGLPTCQGKYPWRMLHKLFYKYSLPHIYTSSKEARLCFVSGYSINFDTCFNCSTHEIIPVIWDCWHNQIQDVTCFFKKHKVKTAFFTSSKIAKLFQNKFPDMNIMAITEGVDTSLYVKGKELCNRNIDLLEVGRDWFNFIKTPLIGGIKHVKTSNFSRVFKTDAEFTHALSDTKVSINVPRSDVDKANASNIETLTQRYWECMLSRVVMVGRAPKELIDLIGYNPVIEWDSIDAAPTINNILQNISDYQALVDKNYKTAIEKSSWDIRVSQICLFLTEHGYSIKP